MCLKHTDQQISDMVDREREYILQRKVNFFITINKIRTNNHLLLAILCSHGATSSWTTQYRPSVDSTALRVDR